MPGVGRDHRRAQFERDPRVADHCERSQRVERERLRQVQRIEARPFDFERAVDQISEHVTVASEGRP